MPLDLRDPLDSLVLQEVSDSLDFRDLRVLRDQQVIQALLDQLDKLVLLVSRAFKDSQVQLVRLVGQEAVGQQVLLDSLDHRDRRVHKVPLVHKVLRVPRACLGLKVTPVILAPADSRELEVDKELQDLLVTLVCQDLLEVRAKQALKAVLVKLDQRVKLASLDLRVQKEQLDQLALQVELGFLELRGHRGSLGK